MSQRQQHLFPRPHSRPSAAGGRARRRQAPCTTQQCSDGPSPHRQTENQEDFARRSPLRHARHHAIRKCTGRRPRLQLLAQLFLELVHLTHGCTPSASDPPWPAASSARTADQLLTVASGIFSDSSAMSSGSRSFLVAQQHRGSLLWRQGQQRAPRDSSAVNPTPPAAVHAVLILLCGHISSRRPSPQRIGCAMAGYLRSQAVLSPRSRGAASFDAAPENVLRHFFRHAALP